MNAHRRLEEDQEDVTSNRHLVVIGALLGVAFGIWNLLHSLLFPLAEDTIPALLMFYGPMFTTWGIAAFFATRKTGRIVDDIKAAVTVAVVTGVVFDVMVILRVNFFLHTLTQRLDWQNLMAQFRASGSNSLRGFINYHYATQAPVKILLGATIGACTGLIGALIGSRVANAPRSACAPPLANDSRELWRDPP
jgi:hypothetical protein